MKKKDVLFLCQYFYPEYISSATLPLDTAIALRKSGLTVGVLTGYPAEYSLEGKVPMEENYKEIHIKRLNYLQLKRSNPLGRLVNYFSFLFAVILRFGELRKYQSIIVYSNPPILPFVAALASKVFKVKLVFVSYDVYPEIAHITNTITTKSLISKLMRAINKMVFKEAKRVIALSNEMKQFLLNNRSASSEKQIEVIPNWFEDKGLLAPPDLDKSNVLASIREKSEIVISYFGNMGTCQDLDTLIGAIRELKNDSKIHFMFAGHGNKKDGLNELVKQEQLDNVTVFDFLHGKDFENALSISDCFIVSLAEGVTGLAVPSKTYSYMMASKPIIAIMGSDADIARDLVKEEAGYSIEVGEVSLLVQAIKELKENPYKREGMSRNCRQLFLKKYTTEKCTSQYVKMMHKVLEDNDNV